MKSSSKKAIILNNLTSPYIYQAIVILTENGVKNENTALKEAEKIVSEYISKQKKDESEDILLYSRPVKSARKSPIIPLLATLGLLSMCLFLVLFFFSN